MQQLNHCDLRLSNNDLSLQIISFVWSWVQPKYSMANVYVIIVQFQGL